MPNETSVDDGWFRRLFGGDAKSKSETIERVLIDGKPWVLTSVVFERPKEASK
jgi:hypothetical protein